MRLRSGHRTVVSDGVNQEPPTDKQLPIGSNFKYQSLRLPRFLKYVAIGLVGVYISVPAVLHYLPFVSRELIFLSSVHYPFILDFNQPSKYNIEGVHNFKLTSTDDVQIGVWQVLPASLRGKGITGYNQFSDVLGDHRSIVIYLHGNSGTRASYHRVLLYKILSDLNHHVIAIDYRGYGDSTGTASAEGVIADALTSWDWVKQRCGNSKVYIWGHSLGTAVASALAKQLCLEGSCPTGLILESPFNSLHDAALNHPLALPWRIFPYFDTLFTQPFMPMSQHFQSNRNLQHVKCPIHILHAEDDLIVPHKLGKVLYNDVKATGSSELVKFHTFDGKMGHGHKYICEAEHFKDLLKTFLK
ncbi:lysophosphatidylserine lipase ABHD12-like isoform X2 [Anneissia japonica]|uniref:lysophosphatidylserine lipase ABHD12-like isoform X2 n=1 Tax=Anneissia japonica TaxID=1529436 RepID=UPI001425515F|nr:lysophosphatidylserine lipase ABHD12-like isoform X2 [Anneissia japonica]